jgi:biopolymer transport protein ExbB
MDGNGNLRRLSQRAWMRALCALAVVAIFAPLIRADRVDFPQRLKEAIKQTESELQAEKARIQKEEQTRRSQLDQIRATCRKLADEIVERRISIARKQTALREIRRQRETLWAERTQWQDDLSQIRLICGEVERELGELLTVLPVSEHRQDQLQELANLKKALSEDKPDVMVESVFRLVRSLLHETRSTAVYSADVLDPAGVRRPARLLRVGLNLFAYHTAEASQTAIAISDPYQEGGFRWYEDLSPGMRRAVVSAIDQGQDHAAIYPLPIDVTGTMTAATNLSNKTLIARIRSGGVVMFPLAAVAICLAVLICERLFVLLPETRHSQRFCERILDMCGKGDFEQAEQLAGKTKGVLSRTLKVCIAHRRGSPTVLDDAIQETFLHEFPKLERFLPSIRMLSAVAPILGLLGTVTGIIATFDMITVVGGGKPRLLAGGISEALITTATGLIIAIPGLLAHSFLSGRINGIIANTERFAASLSNIIKQQNTANRNRNDGSHTNEGVG